MFKKKQVKSDHVSTQPTRLPTEVHREYSHVCAAIGNLTVRLAAIEREQSNARLEMLDLKDKALLLSEEFQRASTPPPQAQPATEPKA